MIEKTVTEASFQNVFLVFLSTLLFPLANHWFPIKEKSSNRQSQLNISTYPPADRTTMAHVIIYSLAKHRSKDISSSKTTFTLGCARSFKLATKCINRSREPDISDMPIILLLSYPTRY